MHSYDIIVIGGGPAGLAAALQANQSGIKKILIIERDRELGGILQQCIHNGFGLHYFKKELSGPEYAQLFIDEIRKNEIEFLLNTMVLEITRNKQVKAVNSKDGFLMFQAKAIILAMGCRERSRGAIKIPGTRPAGIFSAGTAQRFLNMEGYMVGKKVVILGSGDIGLIMARRMTLEGAKVHAVVEMMPYSGGLTRNIVQCLHDFNIPLLLSHTVTEIKGQDRVEAVIISRLDEGKKPIPGSEIEYECDTLLLSVGLIPENELTRNINIEIDSITQGPMVNEAMETSIDGIFACGNVVHVHDLVDYVTKESQKAGLYAAKYIRNELSHAETLIKTKAKKGIAYVISHTLRENNLPDQIELFLRVKQVYQNINFVIKADDQIIKKVKKQHAAPGEMESLVLDSKEIKGKNFHLLTVEIEKLKS